LLRGGIEVHPLHTIAAVEGGEIAYLKKTGTKKKKKKAVGILGEPTLTGKEESRTPIASQSSRLTSPRENGEKLISTGTNFRKERK